MATKVFSLRAAAGLLAILLASPSAAIAGEHEARLEELSELRVPEGAGPHPVVVIVPGCSGFKWDFYDHAQARLFELGYATARVDYVAARNLGGCAYQASKNKIAEDVFFVLERLSEKSSIKAESINVLAWSSGGGGALQILSKLDTRADIRVASVAAYSPQCNGVTPWAADVPVLMLLAGADNIAPPVFCRKLAAAGTAGDHVAIEEYAGAYHGFDDADLPPKEQFSFGTMGYDPEAAKKAWNMLSGFLVP